MINQLKYLTIRANNKNELSPLSLSPNTSDQVDNQVILNALVGTLVKYGQTGKIEPYLANSWEVTNNGLLWSFTIRPGFTCENGEIITAKSFELSLKNSFKGNIKKTDKTEFNKLEGWSNFIKENTDLTGLYTENNKLIFNFKTAPNDILNFLRMPYFGLWCNNETSSSDFDINNFRSSGAYRIKQLINSHLILLELRKDQPTYNNKAPQEVQVGTITAKEAFDLKGNVIFKLVNDSSNITLDGFHSMASPPAILQGIVLHPNTPYFSKLENRQIFANRLNSYLIKQKLINVTPSMYLDSMSIDKTRLENLDFTEKPKKVLKIAFQYRSPFDKTSQFWLRLFEEVLKDIPFEIIYPDSKDSNWVKNMLNNPDYDIRTAHVYAGTTYNLSTIKMMFCTRMGISFPDINHDICKLVEKYESKKQQIDDAFKEKFETIIYNDATLFPIYHANDQWLISKTISIDSMPTSIIYPLFENIRINP